MPHLLEKGDAAIATAATPSYPFSLAPSSIDHNTIFWGHTADHDDDDDDDGDGDGWIECSTPPMSEDGDKGEEEQNRFDEPEFVIEQDNETDDDAAPLLNDVARPTGTTKQNEVKTWSWHAWWNGRQPEEPPHSGTAPVRMMPDSYHPAPRYACELSEDEDAEKIAAARTLARTYMHPPAYTSKPAALSAAASAAAAAAAAPNGGAPRDAGATHHHHRPRQHEQHQQHQHCAVPTKRKSRKLKYAGPAVNEGDRVIVQGYGGGVVRFVGLHAIRQKPRVGVELDNQLGKNNGTINNHVYFACDAGYGVLVVPSKIQLLEPGLRKTCSSSSVHDSNGNWVRVAGAGSGPTADAFNTKPAGAAAEHGALLDAVRRSVSSLFGDYIEVVANAADAEAGDGQDDGADAGLSVREFDEFISMSLRNDNVGRGNGSIGSFDSRSSIRSIGVSVA